jgi:hypothetical protein
MTLVALLEAPLREWVPERRDENGQVIDDVVIVGAGRNLLGDCHRLAQ